MGLTENKALVTVIMPAYNAEQYISEAIQSVVDQTYSGWELIIVNDGSTDSTQKQIAQFEDNRIRPFQQQNGGVSSARNRALREMKGEYFCFLDADDRLTPHSLEKRITKFNDSSVSYVDGYVRKWNNSMSHCTETWKPDFKGNPLSDLISITGKSFFGPSWMIRKTKPLYFDEGLTHGEELLFYIRHTQDGGAYDYVDEPVLDYRVHESSAMSNLDQLGEGYHYIGQQLKHMDIDSHLVKRFKSKSKMIMLKSFVSSGNILKGIKYYLFK